MRLALLTLHALYKQYAAVVELLVIAHLYFTNKYDVPQ